MSDLTATVQAPVWLALLGYLALGYLAYRAWAIPLNWLGRTLDRRFLAPQRERRREAGEASYVLSKALGHSVMFGDSRPSLDQLAREAADRLTATAGKNE